MRTRQSKITNPKSKILPCLVMLLGGCTSYTEVQSALVRQAQEGLVLCREAQGQRAALVEELHNLRRQRLDEAFDADVREHPALAADWVIEHRKAYGAAVEVIAAGREASHQATAAAERNLQDIDEAMRKLLMLHDLQRSLTGSLLQRRTIPQD